jgi:epoxyqueuosine reductase QueG
MIMTDIESKILAEIRRYVLESQNKRFPDSDDPFFEEPLIGIAAGDDPIWVLYKNIIGQYHLTPKEMVASASVDQDWSPRSVISWVLPISGKTRALNRQEIRWPSREWVLTANQGNDFAAQLRGHIAAYLCALGYHALVPQPTTIRNQIGELHVSFSSTWSERHIAFAAGLGTFGLNGGLITAKGIAHRCGSIITDLALRPTPRTTSNHLYNCLFFRKGTCGVCMERCPVGAITTNGNNKLKCFERIYHHAPPVLIERYNISAELCKIGSCGFCQTNVPCEDRIPMADSVEKTLLSGE